MINDDNLRQSPIRDFLIQLMILGYDISDDESFDAINENISFILENMGVEQEHLIYLDYEIKAVEDDSNHINILPNNFVTGLWFSGVIPLNPSVAYKNNELKYNGKLFEFNKETKKVITKEIEE